MLFIKHRVNQAALLEELNINYGVEIDLRSQVNAPKALHLSHDPWVQGEPFKDWLEVFARKKIQGPIILNTKEDGLELEIVEQLKHHAIQNYFFLDTALPTFIKFAQTELAEHLCIRSSCFEPIESALTLKKINEKINWVWVDCFKGVPESVEKIEQLKKYFKVCLVSPELQGCNIETITHFAQLYTFADAVCTKVPEQWKNLL